MNAPSLAAVTLAAHANVAAAAGHPLRLPAHPAFLVVRRARFRDGAASGDVAEWFAHLGGATPLHLADPGLDGPAQLTGSAGGWSLSDEPGGLLLNAAPPPDSRPALAIAAATEALERAAAAAAQEPRAPASWVTTARRAAAILASAGTGEELSDVAWPHFLLPSPASLAARRLAAAAATLWCWDQPGAWAGDDAVRVRGELSDLVAAALVAAVAGAAS